MKSYRWARASGAYSMSGSLSLVKGEAHHSNERVTPPTGRGFYNLRDAMIRARANFAGLPIKLELGDCQYDYHDRSGFREILDDLTELAQIGEARQTIRILLIQSIKAKREGKILLKPGYFTAMRGTIERARKYAAERVYGDVPRTKSGLTMGLPRKLAQKADQIIDQIAQISGVPRIDLLSGKRGQKALPSGKSINQWRHVMWHALWKLLPEATVPAIAEHYGKNHKTLLHHIQKIEEYQHTLEDAEAIEAGIRSLVFEA